jgi:F-type H+-transporting ATPase subunit delta
MRDPTIAKNYAETLVSLASKAKDLEGWGSMISQVANAMEEDQRLLHFLDSPRVSVPQKNAVIAKAFQDRFPRLFVRFIQAVISHRRQALIPAIASAYHAYVDEVQGRVHAQVILARHPNEDTQRVIVSQLSRVLKKTVVPHFVVRPDILGGVIVKVGDTVMDGSVRRRLRLLRFRMMVGSAAAAR